MRKLSLTLGLIFQLLTAWAQNNPHGDKLLFDCSDCHTTRGWYYSPATARFNHDSTRFILEGQHLNTNCRDCHKSLVFTDAGRNCIDCHADMHNNTVGPDCARCHTPVSWIVGNITGLHQNSRFPLVGAHNSADCAACHASASQLEFQPLGVQCIDCHRQDYMATTKPNHLQAGLSTNCMDCHRADAFEWSSSGFNHDFFPLTKGHAITDCAACHHSGQPEPLSADCFSCHQSDFNSAGNPSHQSAGFSTKCSDCHTTDPGWKPAEFEAHDAMYFPVYSGKHQGEWENCSDCHNQSGNYSLFSCTGCHEHNKANSDEEHRGVNGYSYNSLACFACHPSGRGEGAINHNSTGFPLKGAHLATSCLSCHSQGFSGTASACENCHGKNYSDAENPNHVKAGISRECQICHDEGGWIPSSFNHNSLTGFSLAGGHAGHQCADCHKGTTAGASQECISCHQGNYNQAKDHVLQKYPFDCLKCHTTSKWEGASFNHNNTSFPLTGAHLATECSACHTNGFSGTPVLCSACHTDNYNQAQNPVHTAAGISTGCEGCHGTDAWIPSGFNHTTATGFSLTGGHAGRQCADCHKGTTAGASQECISCHQGNYNQAKDHVLQKYPFDCRQCHTINSWEGISFDHSNTSFPLTGAHLATECSACHTNGFSGTPVLCSACHTDNYNQAQNPVHTAAGISTGCEGCHGTDAWIPSGFNHTTATGFSLTGGHAGRQCADCHKGTTAGASQECISCHQGNYNQAKDHVLQKYPFDCLKCHTTSKWEGASFNHNSTSFPLTGAHLATECSKCHSSGFAGTTTQCSECHQTDYNQSVNPSHSSLGISIGCSDCHTTSPGWEPASFPIHNNFYTLKGAHVSVAKDCYLCHAGDYNSTPNTCFGCHAQDYKSAVDPPHATAQFPVTCQVCHTENAWIPSTFNHDGMYFPIYSGKHRGRWSSCADCHTVPANYAVFSCLACHEHNQADMDAKHHEVSNYVYNSANCLACHPSGISGED